MSLDSTCIKLSKLEATNERRQREDATYEGEVISKDNGPSCCNKDDPEKLPVEDFLRS